MHPFKGNDMSQTDNSTSPLTAYELVSIELVAIKHYTDLIQLEILCRPCLASTFEESELFVIIARKVMLEAVKSRSILPSTTEFYLNRFSQRHGTNNRSKSASSCYQIHGRDSLELKSKIAQHPKNAPSDFSRNLRTPAASRSNSQVVLQPLMGNNQKRKSQGFQRHKNRSNHRRKTTTIDGN
ncbi:hypothetical protein F511_06714 [Dorcoceras hygrometricum]|uniref:Uncharacterized protein n=1 Tax=Dorcoceras hygrometricum TaxID=472368 RepID=A0A2Z7BD26_9LAMI|nr:hypothetical protein F511_06714 [Dorcoceras hygrometricum]